MHRNAVVAPSPEELTMIRLAFVMVALTALPLGCLRAAAPAAAPVSVLSFPWFDNITENEK